MTECKTCGANLVGTPIKAKGEKDSLLDFLKDIPKKGEKLFKYGKNDTRKVGYIVCPKCSRRIDVSPKMIRKAPNKI